MSFDNNVGNDGLSNQQDSSEQPVHIFRPEQLFPNQREKDIIDAADRYTKGINLGKYLLEQTQAIPLPEATPLEKVPEGILTSEQKRVLSGAKDVVWYIPQREVVVPIIPQKPEDKEDPLLKIIPTPRIASIRQDLERLRQWLPSSAYTDGFEDHTQRVAWQNSILLHDEKGNQHPDYPVFFPLYNTNMLRGSVAYRVHTHLQGLAHIARAMGLTQVREYMDVEKDALLYAYYRETGKGYSEGTLAEKWAFVRVAQQKGIDILQRFLGKDAKGETIKVL